MPPPRGKRTTLTVDRETFEEYFYIGSDGTTIARDAIDARMIQTPYEAIEMVCLVNQLEAEWHYWDMVAELEPHGKDDDYIAAQELGDTERSNRLILEYVGRERLREMLLEVRSDVREELGIPEVSRRKRGTHSFSSTEPDDQESEVTRDKFAPAMNGEPAVVPVARWRFERHFQLDGPAYWIVLDAFRQSVIATPYETVKMLSDVNLMYSARLRENAWRLAFEQYPNFEELEVAVRNGTFAGFAANAGKTEWFEQMFDNLMLEIRTAFGVPELEEIGKAEKYKLWLESRRKPIN